MRIASLSRARVRHAPAGHPIDLVRAIEELQIAVRLRAREAVIDPCDRRGGTLHDKIVPAEADAELLCRLLDRQTPLRRGPDDESASPSIADMTVDIAFRRSGPQSDIDPFSA